MPAIERAFLFWSQHEKETRQEACPHADERPDADEKEVHRCGVTTNQPK